jgi:hypothetical protein
MALLLHQLHSPPLALHLPPRRLLHARRPTFPPHRIPSTSIRRCAQWVGSQGVEVLRVCHTRVQRLRSSGDPCSQWTVRTFSPLSLDPTDGGSRFSKGHRVKALVLIVGTNLLLGSLALYASIDNYPGGVALSHLSTLHTGPSLPSSTTFLPDSSLDSQPRSIHVDSHSAMTGASKFHHPFSSPPWFSPPLPSSSTWTYSRSESLSILSGDYESFDYLITGSPTPHLENFESIHVVEGFKKFQIVVPSAGKWSPIQRRMESSVWTLRKKQAQLQGDGGYTE